MTTTVKRPGRIVVGVDGSEHALRAAEWAAQEAERTGDVLEIHAASYGGFVYATPHEVKETLDRFVDEARGVVEKVAPGVKTKAVLHEGSPVTSLVAASKGADLVVVGTRGVGGFKGLVLGSTSNQVVAHAHCPVAVIR